MSDSKDEKTELIALVERARAGDKECLSRLAKEATVRLHEFIYRQTLQEDLTKDVVQETIVEMLQVFNKLKHVERFWYWLYGIAYNKLRRQYSKRKRHRAASLSDIPYNVEGKAGDETVANVVSDELRQIVVQAMQTLDPRHRAILTMRCYDQMSYADIAGLMNCTEFGARALFYRAKKSLAKKLNAFGLGKGALVAGLVLFGKMTAANKASAASVVVTAGSLEVGSAAAVAAVLTSKAALVAITAGALTTGTLITTVDLKSPLPEEVKTVQAVGETDQPAHDGPHWYFFPDGPQGPMMLRTEALEKQVETRWGVLQNAIGNFQWIGDQIYQNNHHWYREDLSVMRLPIDDPGMRTFLTEMDGRSGYPDPTERTGRDLLVICDGNDAGTHPIRTVRHHNVLLEDYFQPYCPEGVTMVDARDAMRRRGWTYFTVDGHLHGQQVKGSGRIPFVYATLARHKPWLRLQIGDSTQVTDTPRGAAWASSQGTQRYPAGTFFQGLLRPWMGLHVLDSIRRDAAAARIPFTTDPMDEPDRVRVSLTLDDMKLSYVVDLKQDLIRGIEVLVANQQQGVIRFNYLQNQPAGNNRFVQPAPVRGGSVDQNTPTMRWLFEVSKRMD